MNAFKSALKSAISGKELKPYVYSYPSKRAYKKLENVSLADMWNPMDTGPASLYIHIPFCHYRCTYCTLFLTTRHTANLIQQYVDKICEQLKFYSKFASNRMISSIYFGGGTPTVLSTQQFEQIFQTLKNEYHNISSSAEVCIEGSPDTMSVELLNKFLQLGVNRISMGIQTMDPAELRASGRPYSIETTLAAISSIKSRFDNFNLDLIYGLSGQSYESWEKSLEFIVDQRPMTISLYPVISRPLTVIQKQKRIFPERYIDDSEKLNIYDKNVKYLEAVGYRQESFTRFTRLPKDYSAYEQEILDFQGIPIIGIGAGARSNTGRFHYSFDYAVDLKKVGVAVDDFLTMTFSETTMAQYGVLLSSKEERLRYFLLSLTVGKLSPDSYKKQFKGDLYEDFSDAIEALESEGIINSSDGLIKLTKKGYKFSNVAAHLLFSEHVKSYEEGYVPQ